MGKFIKNQKGLTLIEMLIAILIFILASVFIVSLVTNALDKPKEAGIMSAFNSYQKTSELLLKSAKDTLTAEEVELEYANSVDKTAKFDSVTGESAMKNGYKNNYNLDVTKPVPTVIGEEPKTAIVVETQGKKKNKKYLLVTVKEGKTVESCTKGFGRKNKKLATLTHPLCEGTDDSVVVAPEPEPTGVPVQKIRLASGNYFTLGVKSDGSLIGWGANTYGELANKPTTSDFVSVAAATWHGLALRNNGTLISWGEDMYQQVTSTPTDNGYVAIDLGGYHSIALKSDGSIVSWGRNIYSQVAGTPVEKDFIRVAAGGEYSIALKKDGRIVGWGRDNSRQIIDIPTTSDFKEISAGASHAVGLRNDGSIASWGLNTKLQVTNTPTGTGYKAISAGFTHSVAIRSDGSLVTWGSNDRLQVTNTPTGNDFVAIATGQYHSSAVRADGTVVSWGDNSTGQVSTAPTGSQIQ
jgi:prepilin-type N-terminal cleavage/methylation domain-containing protein